MCNCILNVMREQSGLKLAHEPVFGSKGMGFQGAPFWEVLCVLCVHFQKRVLVCSSFEF